MTKREIRKRLKEYFSAAPHSVGFTTLNGTPLVCIEYEDFRSEPTVKAELRQIFGQDVYLNVKRNCSERLMRHVYHTLCGSPEDLKLHLMETLEMPSGSVSGNVG